MTFCYICQLAIRDGQAKRTMTQIVRWGRIFAADAHENCVDNLSTAELVGVATAIENNLTASEARGAIIGARFLQAARTLAESAHVAQKTAVSP